MSPISSLIGGAWPMPNRPLQIDVKPNPFFSTCFYQLRTGAVSQHILSKLIFYISYYTWQIFKTCQVGCSKLVNFFPWFLSEKSNTNQAPPPSLGLAPHSPNVVVQKGRNVTRGSFSATFSPQVGRVRGAFVALNNLHFYYSTEISILL